MTGRLVLATALVLVVLVGLAGGVALTEHPVCALCEERDELGGATITVSFTESGAAVWTISAAIENASLAEHWRVEGPPPIGDPGEAVPPVAAPSTTSVSVTDDDHLEVEIVDTEAGHPIHSTVTSDVFASRGTEYYLESVTEVRMEPPDGYAVSSVPEGAQLEDGSLVWSETTRLDAAHVVFVPADAILPGVRAQLAIGSLVVPPVVADTWPLLLASAIALGFVLAAVVAATRREVETARRGLLVGFVSLAGGLLLLTLVGWTVTPWYGVGVLFCLGLGSVHVGRTGTHVAIAGIAVGYALALAWAIAPAVDYALLPVGLAIETVITVLIGVPFVVAGSMLERWRSGRDLR